MHVNHLEFSNSDAEDNFDIPDSLRKCFIMLYTLYENLLYSIRAAMSVST